MLKIMLFMSMFFQSIISILSNQMGEVIVEPTTPPVEPPVVEPDKDAPIVPPVEVNKNDILRDMSKEYGVNLFDVEGLKKFKEYQESQKTELEKYQEKLKEYEAKETEWANKSLEYASKLKASELGIPADKLEDALKLAQGNPDNLAEVIKKYPIFVNKGGVKIGVQQTTGFQEPNGDSDVQAYMAANPHLYGKRQ